MSDLTRICARKPRIVFSFDGVFVGWGEDCFETSWKSGGTLILRIHGENIEEKSNVVCEVRFNECISYYAGGISNNPLRFECEKYSPLDALVEFEDSEWAGPRQEGNPASLTRRHYAVFFINDMYMLHVLSYGEPKIQITKTHLE